MRKKTWIISLIVLLVVVMLGFLSFTPFINYIGKSELYAFADWMYKTCERSELTLDDANIEIGDHNHDHNHADDDDNE